MKQAFEQLMFDFDPPEITDSWYEWTYSRNGVWHVSRTGNLYVYDMFYNKAPENVVIEQCKDAFINHHKEYGSLRSISKAYLLGLDPNDFIGLVDKEAFNTYVSKGSIKEYSKTDAINQVIAVFLDETFGTKKKMQPDAKWLKDYFGISGASMKDHFNYSCDGKGICFDIYQKPKETIYPIRFTWEQFAKECITFHYHQVHMNVK